VAAALTSAAPGSIAPALAWLPWSVVFKSNLKKMF